MPCIIYRLSGLYCGGCGTTRMLISLIRGDITGAYTQNRALFLLLPVWLTVFLVLLLCRPCRRHGRKILFGLFLVSLLILFLFGILRNLPSFSSWQPY